MCKRSLRKKLAYSSAALCTAAVAALIFLPSGAAQSERTAAPCKPDTMMGGVSFKCSARIFTQYGLVEKNGRSCSDGTKGCTYYPLPGSLIETYTVAGKFLHRARTGRTGYAVIPLVGGVQKLKVSHTPWHGRTFGTETFTIRGPIAQQPDAALTLTFCVSGSC